MGPEYSLRHRSHPTFTRHYYWPRCIYVWWVKCQPMKGHALIKIKICNIRNISPDLLKNGGRGKFLPTEVTAFIGWVCTKPYKDATQYTVFALWTQPPTKIRHGHEVQNWHTSNLIVIKQDFPLNDSVALPLIQLRLWLTPFTLMTEHVDFFNFLWWPCSHGRYCILQDDCTKQFPDRTTSTFIKSFLCLSL